MPMTADDVMFKLRTHVALLVGTDAIKKNIQEHARVSAMFATALAEGMRTLRQDGIEKVLMGITDIRQVRSVCIK